MCHPDLRNATLHSTARRNRLANVMRIGLTGGMGSGKSRVARLLAERGAVVVDADRIAREVVAAGTPGLSAVLAEFGPRVRAADGGLDRAALAGLVFGDRAALARLEAITHPLIWTEAARQFAAVPADGIVVHDMPLLVEKRMSADYHLVIVVLVDAATRVARLGAARGVSADDAWARISAQATDAERRAAADIPLENEGSEADLEAAVDQLWQDVIAPFAGHLAAARPAPDARRISADAVAMAQRAARVSARIRVALDDEPVRLTEIVREPGRLALALELSQEPSATGMQSLAAAGFPQVGDRLLGCCDPVWPGRIALAWPGADPGVAH